jgi:hypothetical protein
MQRAFSVSSVLSVSLLVFFHLGLFNPAQAATEHGTIHKRSKIKKVQDTTPTLSESEHNSLRYRLENAWNEVDLLVRNAATDQKDIAHQERDFKNLQVFKKFPLASADNAKYSMLTADLKKSAQRFGMKVTDVKVLETSKPDKPVPAIMPQDAQEFKFTDDQLMQKVRMDLTLTGTKRQLQDWMNSWNLGIEPGDDGTPTPYLEWDPNALTTLPEVLSDTSWKVHAQAYLFRDIKYPKLQPQNPLRILPTWAQKNTELFKQEEPLLWGLVEKTQATIPQALPGYERKATFLLNAARMSYFTTRVTKFE